MSLASLPDELWEEIEPLLPPDEPPGPQGGRPPVPNRVVMRGTLLYPVVGHPLGGSAARDRVQWNDMLATASQVAVAGNLGSTPSSPAGGPPKGQ